MNFKLSALLVLSYVTLCYSAVAVEGPNPKAEKGKCLPTSGNVGPLNYGESKTDPNGCVEVSCSNDGSVQYASCGVVGLPPNCKFVEPDKNAPYPKCCKTETICT